MPTAARRPFLFASLHFQISHTPKPIEKNRFIWRPVHTHLQSRNKLEIAQHPVKLMAMKMPSFSGNRRGVSLIETLFAVVLISAVGVIMADLLHKNTINLAWNRQTRKAAALADMVLEKYDYLASVQFATLEQLNQSTAPVSAFFATGNNNQGYDGMYLTTVADPTAADGSRKLTVKIAWGGQTASQTFTMTKTLTPGTGVMGGAPVHVYVLDLTGTGIPGFEVRAMHHYNPAYLNAVGTNEEIAFTDANGYAVLNNVSVDPALQPIAVYASRIISDEAVSVLHLSTVFTVSHRKH